MKRVFFLLLIVFLSTSVTAGEKWEEELLEDVVEIKGDKMVIESFGLISMEDFGESSNMQVRIYSEAPAEGSISRDNFVSMTSMISLPYFIVLGEYTEIDAPIGKVDMEISIYMAVTGLQVEFKDHVNDLTTRETQKWSESNYLPDSYADQAKYEDMIKQDVVKIKDNKMILEDFGLVEVLDEYGGTNNLQVKLYCEAPSQGIIGRDNFLSMATMMYFTVLFEMGKYSKIDAPIGKFDFELNIYMSANGFQLEMKDNVNNTTNRMTQTWKEVMTE